MCVRNNMIIPFPVKTLKCFKIFSSQASHWIYRITESFGFFLCCRKLQIDMSIDIYLDYKMKYMYSAYAALVLLLLYLWNYGVKIYFIGIMVPLYTCKLSLPCADGVKLINNYCWYIHLLQFHPPCFIADQGFWWGKYIIELSFQNLIITIRAYTYKW